MNDDSIQKIIEEMREEFFIEPIDEEQVNLWADRLEQIAEMHKKYVDHLQASLARAESRAIGAEWAADQASNHRMGL